MCAYYGAPGRDILNPALASDYVLNANLFRFYYLFYNEQQASEFQCVDELSEFLRSPNHKNEFLILLDGRVI
jgi:hypothetical protein